jgi:hypothetical protein
VVINEKELVRRIARSRRRPIKASEKKLVLN